MILPTQGFPRAGPNPRRSAHTPRLSSTGAEAVPLRRLWRLRSPPPSPSPLRPLDVGACKDIAPTLRLQRGAPGCPLWHAPCMPCATPPTVCCFNSFWRSGVRALALSCRGQRPPRTTQDIVGVVRCYCLALRGAEKRRGGAEEGEFFLCPPWLPHGRSGPRGYPWPPGLLAGPDLIDPLARQGSRSIL